MHVLHKPSQATIGAIHHHRDNTAPCYTKPELDFASEGPSPSSEQKLRRPKASKVQLTWPVRRTPDVRQGTSVKSMSKIFTKIWGYLASKTVPISANDVRTSRCCKRDTGDDSTRAIWGTASADEMSKDAIPHSCTTTASLP